MAQVCHSSTCTAVPVLFYVYSCTGTVLRVQLHRYSTGTAVHVESYSGATVHALLVQPNCTGTAVIYRHYQFLLILVQYWYRLGS